MSIARHNIIEIYDSVIGNQKIIYVSCPILTGDRYFRWLAGDISGDIDSAVRQPNRQFARTIVDKLRTKYPKEIFINPAELNIVDGWKREDYDMLWADVIEKFAKQIYFIPGWQMSVGCKLELDLANHLNLPKKKAYLNKMGEVCLIDLSEL